MWDNLGGCTTNQGCLGAHHLAPFVSTFSDDGDHLYVGRNAALRWSGFTNADEKRHSFTGLENINDAFSETVPCIRVLGEYGVLAALESELVDVVEVGSANSFV